MHRNNQADIFSQVISNRKGHKPLFINVGIQPTDTLTESGPMTLPIKNEVYVCLSLLPDDLKKKVETAIHALMSSF